MKKMCLIVLLLLSGLSCSSIKEKVIVKESKVDITFKKCKDFKDMQSYKLYLLNYAYDEYLLTRKGVTARTKMYIRYREQTNLPLTVELVLALSKNADPDVVKKALKIEDLDTEL